MLFFYIQCDFDCVMLIILEINTQNFYDDTFHLVNQVNHFVENVSSYLKLNILLVFLLEIYSWKDFLLWCADIFFDV